MIVKRQEDAVLADEVGLAGAGEVVDQSVRDRFDARFQLAHLRRGEGPVDELALAHVIRRVGRQQDTHAAA